MAFITLYASYFWLVSIIIFPLLSSPVAGDFLVPTYPTPVDLSNNQSQVLSNWLNLTSTLDKQLNGKNCTKPGPLSVLEVITFSVGLFSVNDPEVAGLQYHHTSKDVKESENGTHSVDENSIYRVASISKLITTYAGKILLSDADWNRPLPDAIPKLKQALENSNNTDPTWRVQWDKITPWTLATQLSGIPTVGLPLAELYHKLNSSEAGAPPLDYKAWSVCAARFAVDEWDQYCPLRDIMHTIHDLQPNFLPWSTPVYSDLNFMLLGVAIANITGKSASAMYRDAVFGPLNMTSSNDTHATDKETLSRSVVAGPPKENFALETGFTTPSGGLLSTISDLQKLGVGILNHTLLSAEATRKWMKPTSHTASLSYSIGAPWEIHRYVNPKTGKVTDMYTKLGDSGYYGGAVVLIPEYDAGFTMLNAGIDKKRASKAFVLLDYVTATVLPALEAQAALQAKMGFVGTYNSSNPDIPATLKIGWKPSTNTSVGSELVVTEWIYNGTDIIASPFFNKTQPRLEQAIQKQTPYGKPGKVSFQLSIAAQTASYMEAMGIPDLGVIGPWTGFYTSNGDFAFTDSSRWRGRPVDVLVFEVDDKGRAVSCNVPYEAIKLKKTGEPGSRPSRQQE